MVSSSTRPAMFLRITTTALCACLILNLVDSQSATDVCPPHLTRDHYLQVRGGSCYQFVVYRSSTHTDAKAECERNGGWLVLIKDQDTQNYLQDELHYTYHFTGAHVWIGLNDIAHENDFVWDDGTRPVYTNWAHGGSPAYSGNHDYNDCVIMDVADRGKWLVFHCDIRNNLLIFQIAERHSFICEYPTHAAATLATAATSHAPPTTPSPGAVVTSITHPCPVLQCNLDCGIHDFKKDPTTGCVICECDA